MLNMKCVYCGEEKENNIHGEYVCSKCLERDFTSCSVCGVWVHNDDIRMVRNRHNREAYVCDDCCSK